MQQVSVNKLSTYWPVPEAKKLEVLYDSHLTCQCYTEHFQPVIHTTTNTTTFSQGSQEMNAFRYNK